MDHIHVPVCLRCASQEEKQDKYIVLAMNDQKPNLAHLAAKQMRAKQAQVKTLKAEVTALQVNSE
jgi:hypothetical protein